ncbi:MAG TPA: hypothetical protein VFW05_02925 [Verrucomicrobiae bacterium]|nr:hypothetical protein [Verrucomicrobiae bacterium]
MRRLLFYLTTTLILFTESAAFSEVISVPLRLAIVTESPEVTTAGDLLTVELSRKTGLRLLERAEIEKVYREQALLTI